MEIPDELRCVFSGKIEAEDGSYTLTVPTREVVDGDIQPDAAYRVGILKHPSSADSTEPETAPSTHQEQNHNRQSSHSAAPVEEGDHRTVDIDGVGEKGDGIARIDNGYVIIVPDTEKRDRVTVEITNVTPNVAFAEVVEHKAYYE
ncbi:TRAM domain-containing protein [Haladaptatus sp. W1]|uniref:TRAM domain-containing protein n=1 Tax=Haladaptatus sp. W1 TaxID=1897478 RepID=UPI0009F63FA9|nr:TRAM domain-containing protein [Haladaptatus sp. W1]